jgi:hypothetical protein
MSSLPRVAQPPPRACGRRLRQLLLAAIPVLTGLAACGHPAPPAPPGPAPVVVHGFPSALGGSSSCLSRDNTTLFPPVADDAGAGTAGAGLAFTPTPAPTGDGGYISAGADLRLPQFINDFPVPPGVSLGPDLTVTLVKLDGHVGAAAGWSPDQRLALQATRQVGPGQVMTWQTCMLDNPGITAAMRAAGHTPLPVTAVPSNATVSGWVAFAAPREADRLAVAISVPDPDGGSGSTAVALAKPAATGLTTSAGAGPAKPTTPAPPAH